MTEETTVGTLDLTPTWAAILPILVEVAANGTSAEGRKLAMEELLRLARFADAANLRIGWLMPKRHLAQVTELRASGMKLGEIAAYLGISRARVWQIAKDAKDRDRQVARHQAIRELAATDRNALLVAPVADLMFEAGYGTHVRTHTVLQNDCIETIGELVRRTRSELMRTPNLGRKSLDAIVAVLAELGLELAPERWTIPASQLWVPLEVADKRMEELEWSTRVAHCLHNSDIVTVRDLASRTLADLMRLPNFGSVSLREVAEMLRELGVVGWPPR